MATIKQQATFKNAVTKYLLSIGAKPTETQTSFDFYKVDTICGELKIGMEQTERQPVYSIYCRFEDEKEAKKILPNDERLNQFSGKWNWHNSEDSEGMLYRFKQAVNSLLPSINKVTN